jgi:hypothetical protein
MDIIRDLRYELFTCMLRMLSHRFLKMRYAKVKSETHCVFSMVEDNYVIVRKVYFLVATRLRSETLI